MTLNTEVHVLGECDPHEIFAKCRDLLDANESHPFTDEPTSEGIWRIGNPPGIGLPAWLWVNYRQDKALRTHEQAAAHEDEETACWLEIHFDTAYGYTDDQGLGCGALHASLLTQLGAWLDARDIEWSWRNEFTGEVHAGDERYERLGDLCEGGTDADTWFRSTVLPAIVADQRQRETKMLYGQEIERTMYKPELSVIGQPETSGSGNLVLRVGRELEPGGKAGWTQTEHVVMTQREAEGFLAACIKALSQAPRQ